VTFGVPEFLLGVTIVAGATSLPDSLVSVRAARAERPVASLAGVVGTKYLLGGALAMVDATSVTAVLVMQHVPLTFAVGTLLGLTAGAIYGGFVLARPMTVLVFLGVVGLSFTALRAGNPVIVVESIGMGVSTLYLLVRKPVERVESTVDEDDSATRHGSTLR
jgi:cation:H+ antiporter